eukprot:s963_g8.t1
MFAPMLPKPSINFVFFLAWGALWLWTTAEDHIALHMDWILTGLCALKLLRLFNKRRKNGTRPHFAKNLANFGYVGIPFWDPKCFLGHNLLCRKKTLEASTNTKLWWLKAIYVQ